MKNENALNTDKATNFSSPELKAQASLIRGPPSTISNNFSSEAAGPIITKLHMQPLLELVGCPTWL